MNEQSVDKISILAEIQIEPGISEDHVKDLDASARVAREPTLALSVQIVSQVNMRFVSL